MLETIKEDLIRFGIPRGEIEAIWEESVHLAAGLSRIVPDHGFFSLEKRLNAYLVTTGQLSELDVAEGVKELSNTILLQTHAGFRKGYQAFIARARKGQIDIGLLNPIADKALVAMQSARGF